MSEKLPFKLMEDRIDTSEVDWMCFSCTFIYSYGNESCPNCGSKDRVPIDGRCRKEREGFINDTT